MGDFMSASRVQGSPADRGCVFTTSPAGQDTGQCAVGRPSGPYRSAGPVCTARARVCVRARARVCVCARARERECVRARGFACSLRVMEDRTPTTVCSERNSMCPSTRSYDCAAPHEYFTNDKFIFHKQIVQNLRVAQHGF